MPDEFVRGGGYGPNYVPNDGTPYLSFRYPGDTADRVQVTPAGVLTGSGSAAPTGTYVQYASAPTGVAATDTANITAAANAVSAAGGGVVLLRDGTYKLNASLPVLPGVIYQGVQPIVVPIVTTDGVWFANAEWNYIGGTVLQGDGTFACWTANTASRGTAGIGATQIDNTGFLKIGLDNFTYGLNVGGTNNMGLVYGVIDELYAKNCSAWGVRLVNFQELTVGTIRTCLCQNGQFYGIDVPGATFSPGNSRFGELYNLVPRDGRNNLLCRGIAFETAGTGAIFNELLVTRLQGDAYNRTQLSVTAGLTNTSTTVTVPDGTQFAVGMPVAFTSTANGYTANLAYVVLSVSGNNLTLGASRTSGTIAATGTGNMTLTSYGFSPLEVYSTVSGANMTNSRFLHIDLEGIATTGARLENVAACEFHFAENVTAATSNSAVSTRNATYSSIIMLNAGVTDFDGNSATSTFQGTRSTNLQLPLRGIAYDSVAGVNTLTVSGGRSGTQGGDIQERWFGTYLYPNSGFGEHISFSNGSLSLDPGQSGVVTYAGTTASTYILPTISTDSAPAGSTVGVWYEIVNVGTVALTVQTDGTQVMNKVVGRTSVSLAAGHSLRVVACKDAGGNFYWMARDSTLVA